MKHLVMACLLATAAFCQNAAPNDSAPDTAKTDTAKLDTVKNDFMLVSTHAEALFESADSLDARLRADGSTLHPATITLRHRIERTLDQAQAALDKGDSARAAKSIKVAEELVTRYSRRIGGE